MSLSLRALRPLAYVPLAAAAILGAGFLTYCTPETTTGDTDAAVCDPDSGANCPCDPSFKTVECYTGPKGTNGKGICKTGKRSCVNGLLTACVGEVLPKEEVCNLADDDCNGKADDVAELANIQPIANCNSPACSPGFVDAGIECFDPK